MKRRFAVLLLLPTLMLFMGNGKKAKSSLVTFHLEGSSDEAPKFSIPIKLGSEMRQYYFKRVPSLTDADIAYFYPFVSENGASYGVGFKLTPYGTETLKALTLTNQGKLLGIRVPNAPYSAVMIDQPVEDGVIVLWEGLTQDHLKAFEKKFYHIEDLSDGNEGRTSPFPSGSAGIPERSPR